MEQMVKNHSDLYIERKKEIEELIGWIEDRYVLINVMLGKNHRVVYFEQKYWDRIQYYTDDHLAIELGIYHHNSKTKTIKDWDYYIDIYDWNMRTKCDNFDIKCVNTYVDTLSDLYVVLEVGMS
jgi:hypothetical protein